jgi:hypothetical protein
MPEGLGFFEGGGAATGWFAPIVQREMAGAALNEDHRHQREPRHVDVPKPALRAKRRRGGQTAILVTVDA